MSRKTNTQECLYYGRKLSNITCDDIDVSLGYVSIGSHSDDEIYWGECLKDTEDMLTERVTITAIYEPDHPREGHCFDIDLEDVLRFAAKYCNGIYQRVLDEQNKTPQRAEKE